MHDGPQNVIYALLAPALRHRAAGEAVQTWPASNRGLAARLIEYQLNQLSLFIAGGNLAQGAPCLNIGRFMIIFKAAKKLPI